MYLPAQVGLPGTGGREFVPGVHGLGAVVCRPGPLGTEICTRDGGAVETSRSVAENASAYAAALRDAAAAPSNSRALVNEAALGQGNKAIVQGGSYATYTPYVDSGGNLRNPYLDLLARDPEAARRMVNSEYAFGQAPIITPYDVGVTDVKEMAPVIQTSWNSNAGGWQGEFTYSGYNPNTGEWITPDRAIELFADFGSGTLAADQRAPGPAERSWTSRAERDAWYASQGLTPPISVDPESQMVSGSGGAGGGGSQSYGSYYGGPGNYVGESGVGSQSSTPSFIARLLGAGGGSGGGAQTGPFGSAPGSGAGAGGATGADAGVAGFLTQTVFGTVPMWALLAAGGAAVYAMSKKGRR